MSGRRDRELCEEEATADTAVVMETHQRSIVNQASHMWQREDSRTAEQSGVLSAVLPPAGSGRYRQERPPLSEC